MKKLLFIGALVTGGFPALVSAGEADYFNIYNVPNTSFNFGTWSIGMGNQSRSATFCIASANYSNAYNNPPPVVSPVAVHENYDIRVSTRYATQGYYFFLDRDGNNTGNARLSFSIEHIDTLSGNSWENLSHGLYDSHAHTGQFRNCKNGKNSQLRITLAAAELENARAGPYRAKLRIEGVGGSSGAATDADNFRADIIVADIVRVSGLTDIPFGVHNPGADQVGERTFCVYANNDTAGYNVSISSPNQDGSGNFFLKSPDDTIPYTVYFKSAATAGFGTEAGLGVIAGNGNNSASNCGGSDNAKLSVSVSDSDIVPSKTGEYSDTLTVLIAPQ